ncbi:hypothetical protein FS749_002861 [Ceratobasidium sp. UAMH 11750]|nr:hypothetical protein FS749_002861 [Ceratobasidium sp. UAMH 11750]
MSTTSGAFKDFALRGDPNALVAGQEANRPASSAAGNKGSRRLKIRKVLTDGYRKNIEMVQMALDNIQVLDFSLNDFQKARDSNKVPPMKAGAPRGGPEPLTLTIEQGPALVVDRDGVLMISYFPGFIGSGLQGLLLKSLGDLVRRCKPRIDRRSGDRRSSAAPGEPCVGEDAEDLRGIENQGEESEGEEDRDEDLDESTSISDDEDEDWTEAAGEPMDVSSSEDSETGSDCSDYGEEAARQAKIELDQLEEEETLESLRRGKLPASSYYWSAGWYGTGMENKRPMVMSSQFKKALSPASRPATIRLLVAKREFDDRTRHLTAILSHGLYTELERLRSHMRRKGGAVGEAVKTGWTSLFPCVAVGFNRTTRLHRDSKGFRNGLDVIGVLGNFTGGNLRFRDPNVVLEWLPGCLAAFDGYDLAHEVEPWEGYCRATLISFCRSSSWRGLKLPLSVPMPTLERLKENLERSVQDREKAAQAIRERQQESSRAKSEKSKKIKRWKMVGPYAARKDDNQRP